MRSVEAENGEFSFGFLRGFENSRGAIPSFAETVLEWARDKIGYWQEQIAALPGVCCVLCVRVASSWLTGRRLTTVGPGVMLSRWEAGSMCVCSVDVRAATRTPSRDPVSLLAIGHSPRMCE